ncbi:MAG TPA: 5,10-methylenetetrahydrofolate reductase [Acidimicrobiia bacterium]|nr:5,10-methylenetetrahydrofolate reductase [Acidimicrobiia bacterium]
MTRSSLEIGHLTRREIEAVERALLNPKYELIPLKNVIDQTRFLPEGATVSITASPLRGMMATVDLAVELQGRGFHAVPHLSARSIADRVELKEILDKLDGAGIHEAFVVGGDPDEYGEFYDGLALLTAMEQLGHGLTEIGVPGYPEGHHIVDRPTIEKAIQDKLPFTSYLTTQMCFVPVAIEKWVRDLRSSGVGLGVYIGIPGVAELTKLISISSRIGVGPSARFLTKSKGLVGRLVRPGGYSPDDLLVALAPLLADPNANILGLHVYSFNAVDTTESWRQEMLAALA